jgi:chromosome segregation ATPase
MTRASKILILTVVVGLGLWGCARGPANRTSQNERVRALEGRCARLEENYRTAAAARDQVRRQAAGLEKERARLQKDLQGKALLQRQRDALKRQLTTACNEREELRGQLSHTTNERDDLRHQLTRAITERDNLQLRHDRVRKGLQALLAQDDSIPTPPPSTTANGPAVGGGF